MKRKYFGIIGSIFLLAACSTTTVEEKAYKTGEALAYPGKVNQKALDGYINKTNEETEMPNPYER